MSSPLDRRLVIELALVAACFVFFVFSVVAHEVAHGWTAYRCGDPTAAVLGRLTFNPIRHIDPFMTLLVPAISFYFAGFLFGGAKPIPVNTANLRRPVVDDILVTAAGPASNLLIAAAFLLLMHVPLFGDASIENAATILMGVTAFLNLLLAFFNLMPIPPLDGSHIVKHFLPGPARRAYEAAAPFGILIVLLVVFNVPAVSSALFTAIFTTCELFGHSEALMRGIISEFVSLGKDLFQG